MTCCAGGVGGGGGGGKGGRESVWHWASKSCMCFYLFIFPAFYFFDAHSCCNHKLDSQKNQLSLSGVASWRDCCTTASANVFRARWGNDFSSWALEFTMCAGVYIWLQLQCCNAPMYFTLLFKEVVHLKMQTLSLLALIWFVVPNLHDFFFFSTNIISSFLKEYLDHSVQ